VDWWIPALQLLHIGWAVDELLSVLARNLDRQRTLYKPTKCQNVSTGGSGTDSAGDSCAELTVRCAPELTVTRVGDSLRHNGCYPMALCFLFSVFFLLVVVQRFDCELKRAGGRAASLLARAPLRRIPTTKGGCGGRVIHNSQSRARRSEAMVFKLRSTSCFKAKGFSRAFSCCNRSLVCSVTSALVNTRARGVCAAP
jgi:hypothetical protein